MAVYAASTLRHKETAIPAVTVYSEDNYSEFEWFDGVAVIVSMQTGARLACKIFLYSSNARRKYQHSIMILNLAK